MTGAADRYVSRWKDMIRRALDSYADVYRGLHGAREYHRARSSLPYDDMETPPSGFKVEIPLLWGSF